MPFLVIDVDIMAPPALLTIEPEKVLTLKTRMPSLAAVIFCVLVIPPRKVATVLTTMPLLPVSVPELTMPPPVLVVPNTPTLVTLMPS